MSIPHESANTAAIALHDARAAARVLLDSADDEVIAESADALVNRAYARAAESLAQGQPATALALLDLLRLMEPGHLVVDAARLRCLAELGVLGDSGLEAGARELLRAAEAAQDEGLQALAHGLLALSLDSQADSRMQVAAQLHADRAETLCRGRESQDGVLAFLTQRACAALRSGDSEAAERRLAVAQFHAQAAAQPYRLAVLQPYRALLDRDACDSGAARKRLDDSQRLYASLQRPCRSAAHALAVSASVHARMGQLGQARADARAALQRLGPLQAADRYADCPARIALALAEFGGGPELDRALASFAEVAGSAHPRVMVPRLATQACLAFSRGELALGRTLFHEAIARSTGSHAGIGHGVALARECAIVLIHLELVAGDFGAIDELARQMRGWPGLQADLALRSALMRSAASRLQARGSRRAAFEELGAVIAAAPQGREAACANLDLAWLHLNDGDVVRGERLLVAAGAWRLHTPAGLAVQARLHLARGDAVQAAQSQRQAIKASAARTSVWQQALLQDYESACDDAGQHSPPPALAAYTGLLSDAWLPQPAGALVVP